MPRHKLSPVGKPPPATFHFALMNNLALNGETIQLVVYWVNPPHRLRAAIVESFVTNLNCWSNDIQVGSRQGENKKHWYPRGLIC